MSKLDSLYNDMCLQKTLLADNLNKQGVSTKGKDTYYNDLIEIIPDITKRTDITQGAVTCSSSSSTVTISGLPFRPKKISIFSQQNFVSNYYIQNVTNTRWISGLTIDITNENKGQMYTVSNDEGTAVAEGNEVSTEFSVNDGFVSVSIKVQPLNGITYIFAPSITYTWVAMSQDFML